MVLLSKWEFAFVHQDSVEYSVNLVSYNKFWDLSIKWFLISIFFYFSIYTLDQKNSAMCTDWDYFAANDPRTRNFRTVAFGVEMSTLNLPGVCLFSFNSSKKIMVMAKILNIDIRSIVTDRSVSRILGSITFHKDSWYYEWDSNRRFQHTICFGYLRWSRWVRCNHIEKFMYLIFF